MRRILFILGILLIFAAPAFADDVVDDDTDPAPLNEAVQQNFDTDQMNVDTLNKQTIDNIKAVGENAVQTEVEKRQILKAEEAKPDFFGQILRKALDPSSDVLKLNVNKTSNDMMTQTVLGYSTIEKLTPTSDQNNFSTGAYTANEGYLKQLFGKLHCIPTSLNASADCIASGVQSTPTYENFIDFFTSDRTWSDIDVLNTMVFARRFFADATDKIFLGQGTPDASNFIGNESGLTQADLRMGIINNIASSRAPTSTSANTVGSLLLQILVPNRKIKSLNYQKVCAKDAKTQTPDEAFACSFSTVQADGQRVISQSAIDRIVQFDFMLSPMLYNQINSHAYSATGPIQRVKVHLKALQLAQDYRALQLLQMKTLATAMNMMNPQKAP